MDNGAAPGPPAVEPLEAESAADAAEVAEDTPAEAHRELVVKTDAKHQAGDGIGAERSGHRSEDPGGAAGNTQVTARGEGEAAAGVAEISGGSKAAPMEALQQGIGAKDMSADNQQASIILRPTPRGMDTAADLGQLAVDRSRLMRVQSATVTGERGFQLHAIKEQHLGTIGGIGSAVSGGPGLGDSERGAERAARAQGTGKTGVGDQPSSRRRGWRRILGEGGGNERGRKNRRGGGRQHAEDETAADRRQNPAQAAGPAELGRGGPAMPGRAARPAERAAPPPGSRRHTGPNGRKRRRDSARAGARRDGSIGRSGFRAADWEWLRHGQSSAAAGRAAAWRSPAADTATEAERRGNNV